MCQSIFDSEVAGEAFEGIKRMGLGGDAHTHASNLAALPTALPLPPPPIPIQTPHATPRSRRSTADYTQNYEE